MDISSALKVVGRPTYVKQASVPSLRSREGTYLAAVDALVKSAGDNQVAEVDTYARFWGIEDDVRSAREKWAAYNDVPAPEPEDYALNVEHQGQPVQKFAAYDADSTVAAVRAFEQSRHKLPYAWRKTAAVNLLARSKQYNAQIPDYLHVVLEKSAGYGVPTADGLRALLSERMAVLPVRKLSEELDKLALFVDTMAESETLRYDPEMVKSANEAFDLFDRETGAYTYYQSGEVSLPEEAIDRYTTLSVLEKAASAALPKYVTLVNGWECNPHTLDKTALATVDPDLMGMSTAELVDVLPTLPRGDADLLRRLVE